MTFQIYPKESLGQLYFLGYSDKFKYADGNKTDELEGRKCRISSSTLQAQLEVTTPPSVELGNFRFNEEVYLEGVVTIDPYAKTQKDSGFAEVIHRVTAENMVSANPKNSTPLKNDK